MPAFPNGPPGWPLPDDEVRAALLACYASGDWGRYGGANSTALVDALCEQFSSTQAILCSSGTIAVELALRGLKVGPGDEVILAGYDFPGNFRAIEAVGARPVLVDVGENSWTINPQLLAAAVSSITKAVIVSHLHGNLADMRTICPLAHDLGLKVLEDTCQVPGAIIDGRPAGSCGDVGVLSFGGSKLLTAGRGGAILTSQAEIAQRIRVFSDRGNEAFPLSELQAAVLLPQLKKLPERTLIRQQNVGRLQAQLQDLRLLRAAHEVSGNDLSAYYKLAWRYLPAIGDTRTDCSHPSRDELICRLQKEGIGLDAGFRGFHKRSANRCRLAGNVKHSQSAAEATLLLHHPILLEDATRIDLLAARMRAAIDHNADPKATGTTRQ